SLPFSLPTGFSIGIFAKKLNGARDLEFASDGTLFVSLTSPGKIVALADTKNNGTADKIKDLITGLKNPHGLAFRDGKLYVAEEKGVSSYDWDEKNWTLTNKKLLFSLHSGGRHFTRTLVFDKSGKLYISIGSTCDVCFEKNPMNGSILISDPAGSTPRIFAKGLRNSVFITLNQKTDEIWATEMGRDWLGDDAPPDEVNIARDGKDYGWPICYGDKIHDTNFDSRVYVRDPCEASQSPIFEIPAHSAPLGLTFIDSKQFPSNWQGDLLVAYHGSWNRSVPSGYKVVHMKVKDSQILSEEDFLTGFLHGNQAFARPVDLVFDKAGSLYVSDDKAGYIFKIIGVK
ncbi:PQQ-dependent sugar dehydrogenase, partial [Candidatus Gottesmanbacteria bacterium]|nr:PQQ-dependent sugar dehydrogenase [Candidatus Gottesmanbacteria bacterium]